MNETPTIEQRVHAVIREQLCINASEPVQNSARIAEDLGADSLDAVELTMNLEDDFGIEIPDEQADRLKTVQQVIDYVSANVKA